MREGYVTVIGGKIWYKIYTNNNDQQNKAPIIILHGGPGTPHNYLLNLQDLSQHRSVIFYDQLGCGNSLIENADKDLWTISRFVLELHDLINALGINQFHLFGHSWGGSLAVEYALLHSKHVRSLILASPVLSVPLWLEDTKLLLKQLPESTQQIINQHERKGTTESPEYQIAKNEFNNLLSRIHPDPEELVYSLTHSNRDVYQTMWGPSEFTVTGNLKNFDRINDLVNIKNPILITCGRFDEASPLSMQKAQKKCKNAKLVIFENSAHVAHIEEPNKYLHTLEMFLADVES